MTVLLCGCFLVVVVVVDVVQGAAQTGVHGKKDSAGCPVNGGLNSEKQYAK
jgi:hypothetical protein